MTKEQREPIAENKPMPMLHTYTESSRLLGGFSAWSLRRHAQRKNIRTTHLGNRVFLDTEELERIRRDGLPRLSPLKAAPENRPPAELKVGY